MKQIKTRKDFLNEQEWKRSIKLPLSPEEENALLSFKLASCQENSQKYLLLGAIINVFGINLNEFLSYYNTFWVDSRR